MKKIKIATSILLIATSTTGLVLSIKEQGAVCATINILCLLFWLFNLWNIFKHSVNKIFVPKVEDIYFGDMSLTQLQKLVHINAKKHGWWEEERQFGELISLCHSELSEALEEYRKGKKPDETYYREEDHKMEGIPSELADVVIRIMDMCEHYGIDLQGAILEKHKFNISRPYKHGGKVI